MVLKFMDNYKDDKYYARQIVDNISAIQKYIGNKSYDEFLSDGELLDAVMFRLIQLVENIKNITQEFKDKYNYIPWGKIIGFRNGIVHEYGKTDYTIVYETATQDLDELKDIFSKIC